MPPTTQVTPTQTPDARWAVLKQRFPNSPYYKIEITSMAQNLQLEPWPKYSLRVTPEDYLDFTFNELKYLSEFREDPKLIHHLLRVLEDTLHFEHPLDDVASLKGKAEPHPALVNLSRLGVPLDFPMPLVALTEDARDLCHEKELETIKDFVLFAQNMAEEVTVTGMLRDLLNALAYRDTTSLARYLPFRPGATGLHLLEGIALCIRPYTEEDQAILAGRVQTDAAGEKFIEDVFAQILTYIEYFKDELAALKLKMQAGITLERMSTCLNDPLVEEAVIRFLQLYLRCYDPELIQQEEQTEPQASEVEPSESTDLSQATGAGAAGSPAETETKPKRSLWSRLTWRR